MQRLITKFIVFIAIGLAIYMLIYKAYDYYNLPKNNNTCYIWGDSQMSDDVDLQYLDSNSSFRFYSAAAPGAGIYDFMVFAASVPENSHVLIQLTTSVLLRRKEKDRNISAIDLPSLYKLARNGYSPNDLFIIVKNNMVPQEMYNTQNNLLPNADTLNLGYEPVSMMKAVFNTQNSYFDDKKNLYIDGIRTLINKKCKIIAIEFPFHPIFDEIENTSLYKNKLNDFDTTIAGYFDYKESIEINLKENIFHDLTHLNGRGAKYLTHELVGLLDFKHTPMLIKVKHGTN